MESGRMEKKGRGNLTPVTSIYLPDNINLKTLIHVLLILFILDLFSKGARMEEKIEKIGKEAI